jgi:glyoxylase-like metal-dependent hydrolase (beta-lactamase superfamily II)
MAPAAAIARGDEQMKTTLWSFRTAARMLGGAGLALALSPAPGFAQSAPFDEFREAATAAMGRDVTRLELVGEGWEACMGQPWNINEGWARWELREYRRVIDYAETASYQTAMRRAGLDPDKLGGCGAQPNASPAPQQSSVTAASSWPNQLQIWLTPSGFLHLAQRHGAAVERDGDGFKVVIGVESDGIGYTLNGYYGGDHLLRRIETWIDDSVYGDMPFEAEFADYRDFDGLTFPASIAQKQGGYATLNLTIDAVVPDTDASAAPPPREGGGRPAGGAPAADAEPYTEIGDGIYVMNGAYQGVVVEFDDFIAVVDGMQSDARSREIIALAKEAIPGKPIRYAVNTHAHFDHAYGLRDFIAEGATILTHETNVAFFEEALARPRTLNPNAVDTSELAVKVQGVGDHYVVSDGLGQRLELFKLDGSAHADDMLIAYLPSIGTIVESDLLQPWISPVFGGKGHPYLVHLAGELERLGIDYRQFVPVHRPESPPLMTRQDLEDAVE